MPYSTPEKAHANYLRTKKARLAYAREYRKDNPGLAAKRTIRKRQWRLDNADRERAKALAYARSRKYPAPTRTEPDACEVCGTPKVKPLHLDHCHTRNIFRGWLCGGCNKALGSARDNPAILRALASYLEIIR